MRGIGDGLLTSGECAQLAGCTPSTWRAYVARGQAPAPVAAVGRSKLWDAQQVREWATARPGRGRWGR